MKNGKSSKFANLKLIIFLAIILVIARIVIVVVNNGQINDLEGYLYSIAATYNDATSPNATSADATSSNATSADATSSNVNCHIDATSSNVNYYVDATSSNATSGNAYYNVDADYYYEEPSHYKTDYTNNTGANKQEESIPTFYENTTNDNMNTTNSSKNEQIKNTNTSTGITVTKKKNIVSFLQTHMEYMIIIGLCILLIIIVVIAIIANKKG